MKLCFDWLDKNLLYMYTSLTFHVVFFSSEKGGIQISPKKNITRRTIITIVSFIPYLTLVDYQVSISPTVL